VKTLFITDHIQKHLQSVALSSSSNNTAYVLVVFYTMISHK